jgi:superfamily II DNA helicase RecQ
MITATTALGTGVSYPGVMLVVHVGLPYGLIDFSQESGHAGRGGEQVDSLVLLEQGWEEREDSNRRRRRKAWDCDERAMVEFVRTRGCRRLVLARYFDRGEPADCETDTWRGAIAARVGSPTPSGARAARPTIAAP